MSRAPIAEADSIGRGQSVPTGTPRKKRKPTPKQRRLAKHLAVAATQQEAGFLAGYTTPQATSRAVDTLELKFPELLDKYGLTDAFLVEKCLAPGLQAMETKHFAHEGVVIDSKEMIAWGPRQQYLDMTWKLKGKYPKTNGNGHDVTPAGNVTVNINLLKGSAEILDVPALPAIEVKS